MTDRIDLHIHLDFGSADRKLDEILARISALSAQELRIMKVTIQDIQDAAARTMSAVALESDKDDAIIALVKGQTDLIKALREQLAAAIESNDPAALQAVLDSLATIESSALANGDRVLAAVNANTAPATT